MHALDSSIMFLQLRKLVSTLSIEGPLPKPSCYSQHSTPRWIFCIKRTLLDTIWQFAREQPSRAVPHCAINGHQHHDHRCLRPG